MFKNHKFCLSISSKRWPLLTGFWPLKWWPGAPKIRMHYVFIGTEFVPNLSFRCLAVLFVISEQWRNHEGLRLPLTKSPWKTYPKSALNEFCTSPVSKWAWRGWAIYILPITFGFCNFLFFNGSEKEQMASEWRISKKKSQKLPSSWGLCSQTSVCGMRSYISVSPRHLNKSFFEQTNLDFGTKLLLFPPPPLVIFRLHASKWNLHYRNDRYHPIFGFLKNNRVT